MSDSVALGCILLHTECPHRVHRIPFPEVHLYLYICPETECVHLRHLGPRGPGIGTTCRSQRLESLAVLANGSRFVLPGRDSERHADPKLITRGVKRLLPRFLAHGIDAFVPHDLCRTGRTTLGRLKVSPFVGERVINHSKDVLEETYDLWDYFDEKRDALERLEAYPLQLRDGETAAAASKAR